MADMLPGAPGVAELLRRAAAGLEDPCGTDRLRAAWDDGARRAAAWCRQQLKTQFSEFTLEGRP